MYVYFSLTSDFLEKESIPLQNFAQYAINWHLRQNKQATIFQRFKHDQPALSQFLGDHPSLAWIHYIMRNEKDKASNILFSLAQNEKELVSRKKVNTFLS